MRIKIELNTREVNAVSDIIGIVFDDAVAKFRNGKKYSARTTGGCSADVSADRTTYELVMPESITNAALGLFSSIYGLTKSFGGVIAGLIGDPIVDEPEKDSSKPDPDKVESWNV